MGRSELMRVIDIYKQLLPEYMHNICLGVTKRLAGYTFTDNPKETNRLHEAKFINAILLQTKVPSELQRATRSISWGSFKAEEYRNLHLFYFPAVDR